MVWLIRETLHEQRQRSSRLLFFVSSSRGYLTIVDLGPFRGIRTRLPYLDQGTEARTRRRCDWALVPPSQTAAAHRGVSADAHHLPGTSFRLVDVTGLWGRDVLVAGERVVHGECPIWVRGGEKSPVGGISGKSNFHGQRW